MDTKYALNGKAFFLASVVLFAGMAFAAANKGSLQLQHPANVAGKQLASGNYSLRWDGTGDQVDLKIYSGKSVVASVPARMVKMDRPAANNSAVLNTNADGSYSLTQVRFGHKDYALEIVNDGGAGASSSGAAR
ncbi:MAG TPA: hypothetical protein VFA90_03145 [Terriglobales bacterium]|nr:hypothetical protein [Terriglobales bacterium]